jgi:hypothetical protein
MPEYPGERTTPDWKRSALVGYFLIILAFDVLSTWSALLSREEDNLDPMGKWIATGTLTE